MEGREGRCPTQSDSCPLSERPHLEARGSLCALVGDVTPFISCLTFTLLCCGVERCPTWESLHHLEGMSHFRDLSIPLAPNPPEQESDEVRLNHGGCCGEKGRDCSQEPVTACHKAREAWTGWARGTVTVLLTRISVGD